MILGIFRIPEHYGEKLRIYGYSIVSKGHDFILLGGTIRTGDRQTAVKFSVHTSG